MTRTVHPIEQQSYAILRSRVDTAHLPMLTKAVVERVIHASADLNYASDLFCDESALRAGRDALRAGSPVVADVDMVTAGITGHEVVCRIRDAAPRARETRSAAAIRMAYDDVGPGAVWAIGCAPSALLALLELGADPALVIGLPVGFVGAVESKTALRASGLPALTNTSEKGGSAVAAAAVNALRYAGETP